MYADSEQLAAAGWYHCPHPNHPDQVLCFLCRKGLDGWEDGDDALVEHLRHAPECGWAIVAAVEAEVEGYVGEDPKGKRMVEARRGTFAGRWPHEGKKGWKCKTKQVSCPGGGTGVGVGFLTWLACGCGVEVYAHARVG